MNLPSNFVERAFQLAKSGHHRGLFRLKRRLAGKRYRPDKLVGPGVKARLQKLIRKGRAAKQK